MDLIGENLYSPSSRFPFVCRANERRKVVIIAWFRKLSVTAGDESEFFHLFQLRVSEPWRAAGDTFPPTLAASLSHAVVHLCAVHAQRAVVVENQAVEAEQPTHADRA
jgi:hypothetical protein